MLQLYLLILSEEITFFHEGITVIKMSFSLFFSDSRFGLPKDYWSYEISVLEGSPGTYI